MSNKPAERTVKILYGAGVHCDDEISEIQTGQSEIDMVLCHMDCNCLGCNGLPNGSSYLQPFAKELKRRQADCLR